MDPHQLPPERDLPDADRMLTDILQEAPAHRTPWLLPAAAAGGLIALGVGAGLLLQHGGTGSPAATSTTPPLTASPTVTATSTPTSTPTSTGSESPGGVAASTDAAGVQHLAGPGTAQLDHFRVTVSEAAPDAAGQVARRVSVCVVRLGPDPVDGRTRISWDPWSAAQQGRSLAKVTGESRRAPALPFDELFAPGTCSTGFITFDGDASAPVTLRYANSYDERAEWVLEP